MKIIDRHLSSRFLNNLFLVSSSLLFLVLLVDFFEKIKMFISNNASLWHVFRYFCFRLPQFASHIIPAAVLISSLVTFGQMSHHNEITAMKANGISIYRISLPITIISFFMCGLAFFLGEWVTPASNERAEFIRRVEVQKRPSSGGFKRDQIWYRGDKGIYNIRFYDVNNNVIQGVTIYYLDRERNLTRRIDARLGEWQENGWLFRDVLVTSFSDGDFPRVQKLANLRGDIPETPADFQAVQKHADTMGYSELKRYVEKLKSEGYDTTSYLVDLHGKIAFSLASIIMAVIGISFSLRTERSGGLVQGLCIGLIIGFSYWLVFALGMTLGKAHTLPPFVAAWLANIIFGLTALILGPRIKT